MGKKEKVKYSTYLDWITFNENNICTLALCVMGPVGVQRI